MQHMTLMVDVEPISLEETWRLPMKEELKSIERNDIWEM